MSFYKNGQLAASATYTHTNANTATLPLYIGSGINTQFFNGSLDDFGIWTRALSPAEVEQLYNGCSAGINTQPRDTTVLRASSLRLIATAGTGVSYQWQRDSGNGFTNISNSGLFSGATTDTLRISPVDFSIDNNLFRCIVTATSCADTSDQATITVQCNQQLSNHPLSISRDMNLSASFITTSLDPATQFQWQVDSTGSFVNLSNGGQFSGVTADTLRVNNLRLAQTGHRFRCVLTNTPCSDTSLAATLTVINTTSVSELNRLQWKIYPNPSRESWLIEAEQLPYGKNFRLIDQNGRIVQQGVVPENHWQLQAADFAPGMYFLEIDGLAIKLKLLKE